MTVTDSWDSLALYVTRKKSGIISISATVSLDGTIHKVSYNCDGDKPAYDCLSDGTHYVLSLLKSRLSEDTSDDF